jgi:NADPH:quinone reductase
MTTALVCRELTGEDGLVIEERPAAPCAADEVRIRVRAASVNYPDVLVIRGQYQASAAPPFVPGSECAGEVTEVGAEVTGFALGDRVLALTGTGAFATEAVVRPALGQVHRIPPAMSWAEAASINMTCGTAYHGLVRRGRLVAGETVLVTGAGGGCGSAAVEVAKAAGATVVAVAGGAEKCRLARDLGADAVIDHTAMGSVADAVKAATGGRGVDVLFDPVGGEDIRPALRCLAWGGRYLVVGFAAGIPVVRLNQAILKNISLVGVAYGMSAMLDPRANAQDWEVLFDWYERGLVRPSVTRTFPLADGAEALRSVHERQAVGKVVIEMPA